MHTEVERTTPIVIKKRSLWFDIKKNKVVYLLALPMIAYFVIFCYIPMYGNIVAFKNFNFVKGFFGSDWVGMKYFNEFFQSPYFPRLLRNTFLLSFFDMLVGFPAPILLALMLNEVRSALYKRVIQTVTYMTYFISMVVICGLIRRFTVSDGLFNDIIAAFGGQRVSFLNNPAYFRTIHIASGIWQGIGWGSIIYLSALTSIDPELYDAAAIDGAGRFGKIWHISLPGIRNTVIVMLILRAGGLLSVGSEKILLLYNEGTYETADVFSTYVYRKGIVGGSFSFAAAVDIFNSLVNLILVVSVNWLARKFTEYSLW